MPVTTVPPSPFRSSAKRSASAAAVSLTGKSRTPDPQSRKPAATTGGRPSPRSERAAEGELQALDFVVLAFAQGECVADRDRPDRCAPHQRDTGGHAQLVGIEGVDVAEHVAEVDEGGD